ncbi:MAG: hypothetical protein Q4E32_02450, partial [Bacteroidales bacterium]|nr:hypothetical protein [Bacteroidales bacterium]
MYNSIYYFDDIGTPFRFGRYKGWSLRRVIEQNPSYLYWCVDAIPSFRISPDAISQIREMYPMFIITQNFGGHIEEYEEDDDYEPDYDDSSYDDNYKSEVNPTYERYSGSYAQDIMGYSDDEIDTIFDGDPDA